MPMNTNSAAAANWERYYATLTTDALELRFQTRIKTLPNLSYARRQNSLMRMKILGRELAIRSMELEQEAAKFRAHLGHK